MVELDRNGDPVKRLNGKLLPGHGGLPGAGRPPGDRDFYSLSRQFAKEMGIKVEDIFNAALRGLMRRALAGDVIAAKEILDRFCGKQDKGPQIAVGVNVNGQEQIATDGPPIPQTVDLIAQLKELASITQEIHHIDATVRDSDELEELLG